MSEDTKYNGWKNKPTWLVNIYFGDDTEWIEETVKAHEGELVWKLADAIESYVDEYVGNLDLPDRMDNGFIGDLFGWALAHVDWRELAEGWISENHWLDEANHIQRITENA